MTHVLPLGLSFDTSIALVAQSSASIADESQISQLLVTQFTARNSHKALSVPQLPIRVDNLLLWLKPVPTTGAGHGVKGHTVQADGGYLERIE
ncbi:hypothetical protein E2C01_027196 [Portunus trituberculatus]|uniref:Uncharacterized protein n=1 Tax=Portunus trituberculatus TaxID=210409 RepID=A0A5B7EHA1_PORTR|nr:hypothetical protein [Portunus trituberculatus]